MHTSVHDFIRRCVDADEVTSRRILEVGSYNVNGTVRPHLESMFPTEYVGVDSRPGPGVDRVADCEHLTAAMGCDWDTVVCTEVLEHVTNWRACFTELALATRPGGLLAITTRSPGFPYHPEPVDHWRYTPDHMHDILKALGFNILHLEPDPLDGHPGIFATARKPLNWRPPGATALDHIIVDEAQPAPFEPPLFFITPGADTVNTRRAI